MSLFSRIRIYRRADCTIAGYSINKNLFHGGREAEIFRMRNKSRIKKIKPNGKDR